MPKAILGYTLMLSDNKTAVANVKCESRTIQKKIELSTLALALLKILPHWQKASAVCQHCTNPGSLEENNIIIFLSQKDNMSLFWSDKMADIWESIFSP